MRAHFTEPGAGRPCLHASSRAIPGILSAGIFDLRCHAVVDEFIYALVFLSSPEQKTLPGGRHIGADPRDVFFWGPLMAGGPARSIPGCYRLFVFRRATTSRIDRIGVEGLTRPGSWGLEIAPAECA